MKKILIPLYVLILVLISNFQIKAQTQDFVIQGYVLDAHNYSPLVKVRVDLKNGDQGNILDTKYTSRDGQFVFKVQNLEAFVVEASFQGYRNNSSPKFYFNEFQETYTLDKIYLQQADTSIVIAPIKIDTVPVTQYVENKLEVMNIVNTQGAKTLLYLLNPELNGRDMIPEDYPIKYPEFPAFKTTRKNFNSKFKKDKKKGEPFISLNVFPEAGNETCLAEIPGQDPGQMIEMLESSPTQEPYSISAYEPGFTESNHEFISANTPFSLSYAPTKKFVFVLWKLGPDGEPITTGPEVERRYKIVYFTDDMSAQPNIASNAMFGYAPMKDKPNYNIEIYDQRTDRQITISDNTINPHEYFEKRDIISLLNTAWIKICIQLLD